MNLGAGFKSWRPVQWDTSTSNYLPTVAPNSDLANYSLDQFLGNENQVEEENWRNAQFFFEGNAIKYYDYVRRSLTEGNLIYNPIDEVSQMVDYLCEDLGYRNDSINLAIQFNMNVSSHPTRLPRNIYGTRGNWENFSSPSRDARFKTAAKELLNNAQEFIRKLSVNDPSISYNGNNLRQDMWNIYKQKSEACLITYKNSNGKNVNLSLYQVLEDRLFKLSFDPYHCVEMRWGAEGDELASCPKNSDNWNWYLAEQNLRNDIDRNYDLRMDLTAQELAKSNLGRKEPPVTKFSSLFWK